MPPERRTVGRGFVAQRGHAGGRQRPEAVAPAVLVRDFKSEETFIITRSDVIQARSDTPTPSMRTRSLQACDLAVDVLRNAVHDGLQLVDVGLRFLEIPPAARAASRRGSSMTMRRPASHGSSSRASGTRVVLPAPGGASITSELCRSSAVTIGPTAAPGNCR